jgi:hypothetical protein
MAFKLKGHSLPGPNQNKTSALLHSTNEDHPHEENGDHVAAEPVEFNLRDDQTKKFRHDISTKATNQNSEGQDSNQTTHVFARGGNYGTVPRTETKDGVESFKYDDDGLVRQKKDGDTTRGRVVTIASKSSPTGKMKYVRDAKRINKDGELKTGIFGARAIGEDRYNRILKRKTKKQERKDVNLEHKETGVSKKDIRARNQENAAAREAGIDFDDMNLGMTHRTKNYNK